MFVSKREHLCKLKPNEFVKCAEKELKSIIDDIHEYFAKKHFWIYAHA